MDLRVAFIQHSRAAETVAGRPVLQRAKARALISQAVQLMRVVGNVLAGLMLDGNRSSRMIGACSKTVFFVY